MTDRIHSITITLKDDTRIDDAEALFTALRMIKGVMDVTPNVSEITDHIAYTRARRDLESRLYAALRDDTTR